MISRLVHYEAKIQAESVVWTGAGHIVNKVFPVTGSMEKLPVSGLNSLLIVYMPMLLNKKIE
jgi:hypothetical protein